MVSFVIGISIGTWEHVDGGFKFIHFILRLRYPIHTSVNLLATWPGVVFILVGLFISALEFVAQALSEECLGLVVARPGCFETMGGTVPFFSPELEFHPILTLVLVVAGTRVAHVVVVGAEHVFFGEVLGVVADDGRRGLLPDGHVGVGAGPGGDQGGDELAVGRRAEGVLLRGDEVGGVVVVAGAGGRGGGLERTARLGFLAHGELGTLFLDFGTQVVGARA